jgi:hypothetical protein
VDAVQDLSAAPHKHGAVPAAELAHCGGIGMVDPDIGINDQQEGGNGVQKLMKEIRALN